MKNHIITHPTLHLVLDRPCIAGNIAAIVRLTTATQCALHVCGPLVFDQGDKTKWRAGLDYFFGARVHFHLNIERCLKLLNKPPWLMEVGGDYAPWDVALAPGDVVVLGPETASIDAQVINEYRHRMVTLPHMGPVRSLNLAQCAAVVCFEAVRQQMSSATFL